MLLQPMLALSRPVSHRCDQQQQHAGWMQEGHVSVTAGGGRGRGWVKGQGKLQSWLELSLVGWESPIRVGRSKKGLQGEVLA